MVLLFPNVVSILFPETILTKRKQIETTDIQFYNAIWMYHKKKPYCFYSTI